MFRKLYNWTLHWADTRFGVPALAVLSFAEASFFPIPPDPLLIALSLGKPRRSFYYAAICSVTSIIGGIVGYMIGFALWGAVSDFFFTYILSHEAFEFVSKRYEQNEFITTLGAALTPIPYKVFTISAGVFKLNFATFVAASALGRSGRFFIESALIFVFGDKIKVFIDRYFNILITAFFLLLVLGYFVIKYLLAQ